MKKTIEHLIGKTIRKVGDNWIELDGRCRIYLTDDEIDFIGIEPADCDVDDEVKELYPFNEGDDYWTIEDGEIVKSCWDPISEELHHSTNVYFSKEEDAIEYLNELNKQLN